MYSPISVNLSSRMACLPHGNQFCRRSMHCCSNMAVSTCGGPARRNMIFLPRSFDLYELSPERCHVVSTPLAPEYVSLPPRYFSAIVIPAGKWSGRSSTRKKSCSR